MQIVDLEKLRERLIETEKRWPLKYMFKFIVPNVGGKVDAVVATLPKHGRTTFNHSKDLHFVAVTHVADMQSADEIIEVTKRATDIEGVLTL